VISTAVERQAGDRRRDADSGFTLLELTITASLMVAVGLSLMSVADSSSRFVSDEIARWRLNRRANRVVTRLQSELRNAAPETVLPVLMANSDYISYQPVEGYALGAQKLGEEVTFEFVLVKSEQPNGHDDNGDGLVDEGVVTRTEGKDAVEIGGGVIGLRFNPTSGGVEFAVDVAIVDQNDEVMTRTITQRVSFRN